MRRLFGLTPILLSSALLAIPSGCAPDDDDSSLIMLHNLAPDEGCTTSPNLSETALGSGVIDVNATQGYFFTPLVQNTASTLEGAILVSQRLALVEGVNVKVTFPQGALSDGTISSLNDSNLLEFSQRFSVTVQPDDGLLALSFFALPVQLLAALRGQTGVGLDANVEVQLFGTMGGSDIESQEFNYPVFICEGCLANYVGTCETAPANPRTGGNCQVLQDGIVDCCGPSPAGPLTCPSVNTAVQ